jgi:hypothetical protein
MATHQEIHATLLEVVREASQRGPGVFQSRYVLEQAAERLRIRGVANEQALLTAWNDLFRSGLLGWGYDLSNPSAPFLHLTSRGNATLATWSRDPSNAAGYLAHLTKQGKLNPVGESYIREALDTYATGCHKAAAVMVGAAAESILLEIRDEVVARLQSLGRRVPRQLHDWKAKAVVDAVSSELNSHTSVMPHALREAFVAYWPAFLQQLRTTRNDAGHPVNIDPVSEDVVHAALLVFPEAAGLARKLLDWVSANMP